MKNWKFTMEELYYEDGSLRDIYVLNTNKSDWKKWSDLVNKGFDVKFYSGRTQVTGKRIDIEEVYQFWKDPNAFPDSCNATIKLNKNVLVKCYFFTESEIENDLDPREVKTEEDHLEIINYLEAIAGYLKRDVILTSENLAHQVLLKI